MWTKITRPKYEGKGVGYSSDLSDSEWAMTEPRLPHRNRLGRPPKTETRSVVNALRIGCQWRQLPRGISALYDGAALFLRLARRRRVGADQISSCCCKRAKTGRTRAKPLGWGYR
jgi:putative transposase